MPTTGTPDPVVQAGMMCIGRSLRREVKLPDRIEDLMGAILFAMGWAIPAVVAVGWWKLGRPVLGLESTDPDEDPNEPADKPQLLFFGYLLSCLLVLLSARGLFLVFVAIHFDPDWSPTRAVVPVVMFLVGVPLGLFCRARKLSELDREATAMNLARSSD